MNPTVENTEILPKSNESSDEEVKTNSGMKRSLAQLSEESDTVDDNDYPYPLRRKSIMRAKMESMVHMSPITEISVNLSAAILGTPTSSNNKKDESGKAIIFDQIETSNASSGIETDDTSEGTVTETNDDAYGLISNRNSTSYRVRRLNMDATMNFDDDKTTMAVDDVSFYENHSDNINLPSYATSPIAEKSNLLSPEGSPERFIIVETNAPIFTKLRSLDEISSNSTDSGYGPCPAANISIDNVNATNNRTMAPLSRKSLSSAMQNIFDKNDTTNSFRTFNSLSSDSMDSIDDDYMELLDMESIDNENSNQRPSDINSLISGHIKTVRSTPEMKRPTVRRCLSLNDNSNAIRALSTLFEPKTPEILRSGQENVCGETITPFSSSRLNAERCFKRPEPPSTTDSPINSKRYKAESDEKENDANEISFRPLRKSISMNENQILSALSRSSAEPQLIGDFSAPYMLPLTDGRHHDLKSISSETMASLLRGKYSNTIASYKVIDCRYPYEFEGGHIRGAYNLYTHEQINELFNTKTDESTVEADGPKRNILIFHCEFSSERGPKLSRFLRSRDRLSNSTIYPALHYPEVYLLHGGYKEFFENHSDLCDPIAYRTMLDPSYGNELKHFRAKSKSWTGDLRSFGGGSTQRLKKSRSRLVL